MATQQQLDEARTALHQLQMGQKIVSMSMNGRTYTFNSANIHQLEAYIARLEGELGIAGSRRGRPARVV